MIGFNEARDGIFETHYRGTPHAFSVPLSSRDLQAGTVLRTGRLPLRLAQIILARRSSAGLISPMRANLTVIVLFVILYPE